MFVKAIVLSVQYEDIIVNVFNLIIVRSLKTLQLYHIARIFCKKCYL